MYQPCDEGCPDRRDALRKLLRRITATAGRRPGLFRRRWWSTGDIDAVKWLALRQGWLPGHVECVAALVHCHEAALRDFPEWDPYHLAVPVS